MPTFFEIDRDINGIPTYGIEFCDVNYQIELVQDDEKTLVVTGDFSEYQILFQYQQGTDVLVGIGDDSLAGPSADFEATPGQLNPQLRSVPYGTTLRFLCLSTTSVVVVSLYGLS